MEKKRKENKGGILKTTLPSNTPIRPNPNSPPRQHAPRGVPSPPIPFILLWTNPVTLPHHAQCLWPLMCKGEDLQHHILRYRPRTHSRTGRHGNGRVRQQRGRAKVVVARCEELDEAEVWHQVEGAWRVAEGHINRCGVVVGWRSRGGYVLVYSFFASSDFFFTFSSFSFLFLAFGS